MAEILYKVICHGQLAPGQNPEEVKRKLATVLYKGDLAKVEQFYFKGKAILIKNNLDLQQAEKWKKLLTERIGAIFEIQAIEPPRPEPVQTQEDKPPLQPSAPPQPLYNVVFYGEIAKEQDIQRVKKQLGAFFNVPAAMIEGMFAGSRMMLKENVAYPAAETYRKAFEQTGAVCRIEIAGQEPTPVEAPKVIVPPPVTETKATIPTEQAQQVRPVPKPPRNLRKLAFAILVLGVVSVSIFAVYAVLASPKYSLYRLKKAIAKHDLTTFRKYVDSEKILQQLFAELPDILKTEPGMKAFGKEMAQLVASSPDALATAQEGVKTCIEKGQLDKAIAEKEVIAKLLRVLPLDNRQGITLKELRKEQDQYILALQLPVEVYDGNATLELVMQKQDWMTWQVSEINNLNNFVIDVANLQQTYPYRNLVGTTLYLADFINDPDLYYHYHYLFEELGVALFKTGKTYQVNEVLKRTLEAAYSDKQDPVRAIGNVVVSLSKTGNIEKALKILDSMEATSDKVFALTHTAVILSKANDARQADNLFTQALEVANSINDNGYELEETARALAAVGNFNKALELVKLIKDKRFTILALGDIAAELATSGNATQSVNIFNQALEQLDSIKDVSTKVSASEFLVRALARSNNLNKALEIARTIESANDKTSLLWGIGSTLIQTNDTQHADEVLEETLSVAKSIENGDTKYGYLFLIAEGLATIGDFDKAMNIVHFIESSKSTNDEAKGFRNSITREIGRVLAKTGKFDRAFDLVKTIKEDKHRNRVFAFFEIARQLALLNLPQTQQGEFAKKIMLEGLNVPMPTPFPLQPSSRTLVAQSHASPQGDTLGSKGSGSKTPSKSTDSNLSRELAAKILKEQMQFPIATPGRFPVSAWLQAENIPFLQRLRDQGLVEFSIKDKAMGNIGALVETKMTSKGSPYVISKPYATGEYGESVINIKLCEKVLQKVTGIAPFEGQGMTGKRVEYEWSYENPTPFSTVSDKLPDAFSVLYGWGSCIQKLHQVNADSVVLVLYDDGWRVKN